MKTWTSEKMTGDKYKVAWMEDGVEICSRTLALSGTEEGIAQALRFAAMDLQAMNPDLFTEELTETEEVEYV